MKHLMVVFCLILFTTSLAWGGGLFSGPAGVANGPHDLSTYSLDAEYRTDEESICVFCHTPHGGTLDAPLWNRNTPTSTWSHYNSATMSTTLKGLSTSRVPGPESLLCLSCHDGSISVNHVINSPNDRTAPIRSENLQYDTKIQGLFGNPGSRIGGSPGFGTYLGTGLLSDDHPISFSYAAVRNSTEYVSGSKMGTLETVNSAVLKGVQFFGGADNLECSSCHDPHVDYSASGDDTYAPFLIMPNSGSNLCFACHIK